MANAPDAGQPIFRFRGEVISRMSDIKPGMLVQSKWHTLRHPCPPGLVVAVYMPSPSEGWLNATADVIWSGQSRPIRVELKFIAPLREEQNV